MTFPCKITTIIIISDVLGFWARRLNLVLINKTKRTYLEDFAIPMDCRVEIEECKKIDKHLDLARELKRLWNMRMIVIPVVVETWGDLLSLRLQQKPPVNTGE